jgi:hypothetical protein
MEYSWSLADDSGGGGNADPTDRASVAGGQRLLIDTRRLPHPAPGLTVITYPNFFLICYLVYIMFLIIAYLLLFATLDIHL